jgi:hypothetical protein
VATSIGSILLCSHLVLVKERFYYLNQLMIHLIEPGLLWDSWNHIEY